MWAPNRTPRQTDSTTCSVPLDNDQEVSNPAGTTTVQVRRKTPLRPELESAIPCLKKGSLGPWSPLFSPLQSLTDKLDPQALRPLSIWYHLIILAANPWKPWCWTWIWQSGDLDSHSDRTYMDLYIYIYTYASRVPNFARPNMFCSPYSQAPRLQRPDSQSKYSMCFFHFYFLSKTHKIEGSV